jgi:hypothetical protein
MNRLFLMCPLGVLLSGPVRGGEGLRVPSSSTGTVTRNTSGTTVHYPFGKVEIPKESVWKEKTEVIPMGKLHAKTQGSFRVSYELGREGRLIVARRVQVRVENKEEFLSPATPKLREHEAVHRRINEAEALRIQRELELFRTEELRPAKAEERFKGEFRKQIASVKKLHAQWDENHVFIQTPTDTEKTNPSPSPLPGGEGSP